jgi:cytochrome c5
MFAIALACSAEITGTRVEAQTVSVWRGVYTAAQADRGKAAYDRHCSRCHGDDFTAQRDYPLTGERFIDRWEAHTLEHLYHRIRDTMPPGATASVDAGEKRDAMTYLLQQNGFPAGTTELSLDDDVLATFEISRSTGRGPVRSGALVRVTGCLTQKGERDWELTGATEPEKTALPTRPGGGGPSPRPVAAGTRAISLLNVFPNPAEHRGHTMTATGFLVKKDDSDAINVVSLDMIAPGCTP